MTETPQSSSGQSRDEILARLEEIYANDPAVREHGVTLGEVAEGRVVLHRDVTADMVNSHEICHGGFLFHLADSALAYCVPLHLRLDCIDLGIRLAHLLGEVEVAAREREHRAFDRFLREAAHLADHPAQAADVIVERLDGMFLSRRHILSPQP